MLPVRQKIRFFRFHIPDFQCIPGCHDCCGPVMTSTEEISRLPEKNDAIHEAALAQLSCPYLGEKGCEVYTERPLICRLFGTTPRLPCPHGKRPVVMIDERIERKIYKFFEEVRHVLI